MVNNLKETIKDFTFMLLYLASWNESEDNIRRIWQSYPCGALHELANENLIYGKEKIAYMYQEGIKKAKKLFEKYGIDLPEVG